MPANLLLRWIRKLLGGGAPRCPARVHRRTPARRRPTLEILEARITPTTSWLVTDFSGTPGSAGDVTLRYAITHAQDGDQIGFSSSLIGQTIVLDNLLVIGTNITITGLGASNLAISGNNVRQIL